MRPKLDSLPRDDRTSALTDAVSAPRNGYERMRRVRIHASGQQRNVICVTLAVSPGVFGVLVGMTSPRVIELPRRLEPVARDPFLDRVALLAEVVPLHPPDPEPSGPQPPLRAA